MSIFRREVHAHQAESWLGNINLVSARVGWVLAAMLFSGALLIVLFLVLGQYTRSESANGQIIPRGGLVEIASPEAGMVTRVEVSEGSPVRRGQVLAEISIERDTTLQGQVGEAIGRELLDQQRRISSELAVLDRTHVRERERLDARLASLQRQASLVNEQAANRERQLQNARDLLEQIEPIRSSGQLTALQIHQFESMVTDAESQLDLARLQGEQLEQEIVETRAEMRQLPTRHAGERNALDNRLSEISAQLARNAGARSVVVRAPLNGRVTGLTARTGQSIPTGHQLLAIAPEQSEFVAELWVPPRAIGRIELGGQVTMRYDAFPFRQYGHQRGRILEIGGRALPPEEIPSGAGLADGQSAYRVVVELDRQYVADAGRRRNLRSNMTLQASLLLDRRRLIELTGLSMPDRTPAGDVSGNTRTPGPAVEGGAP